MTTRNRSAEFTGNAYGPPGADEPSSSAFGQPMDWTGEDREEYDLADLSSQYPSMAPSYKRSAADPFDENHSVAAGQVDHAQSHSCHGICDDGLYCWTCGEAYKCRPRLQEHREEEAGVSEPTCSLCRKTFCDKSALRRHEKNIHGDGKIPCPGCGKPFRQDYLKEHYSRHETCKAAACGQADNTRATSSRPSAETYRMSHGVDNVKRQSSSGQAPLERRGERDRHVPFSVNPIGEQQEPPQRLPIYGLSRLSIGSVESFGSTPQWLKYEEDSDEQEVGAPANGSYLMSFGSSAQETNCNDMHNMPARPDSGLLGDAFQFDHDAEPV